MFCIVCSIGISATGVGSQTAALQDGDTVILIICDTVSSICTGIICGVLLMGEKLPQKPGAGAVWGSLLVCLMGILGIATGKEAREEPNALVEAAPGSMDDELDIEDLDEKSD